MTNAKDLPRNYVLAVIDGDDSAATAVIELQRAGFPDTQVFHGKELLESVGAQDAKKGNFLSKALKSIPEHLSEESNYLGQYQDAALTGSSIVAVKTDDGDQAQEIQHVLERFGARNVRFFGALTVTDLSVPSNPSAQENVNPGGAVHVEPKQNQAEVVGG